MLEMDISVTPSKYGYQEFKDLPEKERILIGYAIAISNGVALLRYKPRTCSCKEDKPEDILGHEALHFVVREIESEIYEEMTTTAWDKLDNLCHATPETCEFGTGLGFGLLLENFGSDKNV